jgi:hypothetical protein
LAFFTQDVAEEEQEHTNFLRRKMAQKGRVK